jgi:hypothetical protein
MEVVAKLTLIAQNMVDTRRDLLRLLKEKQSSKRTLPKRKQPRPQLLHLHLSRNTMSKESESRNLQVMPTKEPRSL